MSLRISAAIERWPVAGQFVIARGAKTHVDVLVAAASDGTHVGLGEGTAIYYHGESAESCLAQIEGLIDRLEPMDVQRARLAIQSLLPPGAARNALDCALWDLEARSSGKPLWQLAGQPAAPGPLQTAFTISLGEADRMEVDAAKAAARGFGLLKLKLTGEGDRERVAAVRKGAPHVRLIVDANESWGALDIAAEATALAALGVEMIEQPVPVGQEFLLDGVKSPVPFLADESCQSLADLDLCARYYDGINIKLDKAGGLTEALAMAGDAQARGLKLMVGCMLSTSLGIAPAFLVAQGAQWVDLDGPILLAGDREDGFRFDQGMIGSA
ncbi:MAG: dipeptide epimerase [Sphingomonadales bacterium]|nr:dipeptide epimerase [Sphingomonadales bacterium]MBK9004528.1 dipeptide epimerase [Sphingomonadales bacterium]MBK9269715.1 dipeptide epimerase [Sphingomonadales bacterium]MBP6433344.1 dipeptide epimerase [Sphingorhabdus sp.]